MFQIPGMSQNNFQWHDFSKIISKSILESLKVWRYFWTSRVFLVVSLHDIEVFPDWRLQDQCNHRSFSLNWTSLLSFNAKSLIAVMFHSRSFGVSQQLHNMFARRCNAHHEIKMFYVRTRFDGEIHESVCEMGGCSFIFAVSIISNTKYSEDIGRKKKLMVRREIKTFFSP